MALLVLALILSTLFIVAPWKEPQPEGAPLPNTIKGPNWGVDITGGSRILLRLEATQADIEFSNPSENSVTNFMERFRENIESPVSLVAGENAGGTSKRITVEVGRYVSRDLIISLLKEGEDIIGFDKGVVSEQTQDLVKNSLKTRVDPYGTLGAQFKPLGRNNQFLQFEVSLGLEEAKKLLGKEGLPEVFVDNKRVIWSEHIRNVVRSLQEGEWGVSFTLTEDGKERFADYTGRKPNISDKKGHPGVIYLDRPVNSVIIFQKDILEFIRNQAANIGLKSAGYSEKANKFVYTTSDRPTTPLNEEHPYYLQVPAIMVEDGQVPAAEENYVLSLIGRGEVNQALLMGERDSFSSIVRKDNLVIDNEPVLPVENTSRLQNESYIGWLNRVVGLESWPTLQSSITGNVENLRRGLRISTGGKDEAEELRIILSQRLPVEVTHISETHLDPRLSTGFMEEAAYAALIAFIVVGVLVYSFYKRFKIVIPLLITMASEVIITLGAASAVPGGLMSIGLPGLGGLIAVVGTGVDHQIIITDEVLGEKFSETKRLPIERRTSRAFSVIFAAAATTVAAMVALAAFGFGAMRGFALVTLFGVLISVFITRPAYARIIGTLLEREKS